MPLLFKPRRDDTAVEHGKGADEDKSGVAMTFESMRGEWARTRLWVLYSVYLTYALFGDVATVIPVAAAFEAINFVVRWGLGRTALEQNHGAEYVALDVFLRLAAVVATTFVVVYLHYAFDLVTFAGERALSFMWLAATFVVIREATWRSYDYMILLVHAVLLCIFSETLVFAEWTNYVALVLYVAGVAITLALTEHLGYVALPVFYLSVFLVVVPYHLAGSITKRPPFDDFIH